MAILVVAWRGVLAAQAPQASASSTPDQALDLASLACPTGEERFLPGDYYLCEASRHVGRDHYGQAREMLEIAAGWGSKNAQYVLGLMYFNGDHVAADRPLGLAWLALAAERRPPEQSAVLSSAYNKATTAERSAAERLLARMRPKYADAVAAARAKRRYDRAYSALARGEVYDTKVCISGLTPMVPVDPNRSLASQPNCPSVTVATRTLDRIAGDFFEGWEGVVHVGRPIPVPAPPRAAPAKP